MPSTSSPSKSQHGFSLIETGIAITVVGLVIIAIWFAAGAIGNSNDRNQQSQDLLQLVGNVRKYYYSENAPAAGTDMTPALIRANVIPARLAENAGRARHHEGGQLQFIASDTSQFDIRYQNLDAKSCISLIAQLAGTQINADNWGLLGISTNSGNFNSAPISPGAASTMCNSANNRLDLRFMLDF